MTRTAGVAAAMALISTAVSAGDPPGQYPRRPIEPVALFSCPAGQRCTVTCSLPRADKVIPANDYAVVYKYPNSNRLWLWAAGGPNEQYYLGETFCDFTKMLKVWPPQP